MNDVEVRNADGVILGAVHPGVARRALKYQGAKMIQGVLYMPEGINTLPSFRPGDSMTDTNTQPNISALYGLGSMLTAEHAQRKTVWVLNLGETVLSMTINLPQGNFEYLSIQPGPEPTCVTDRVPYEALERSSDFTRFARARPAVMKLMSEEEVLNFYKQRAIERGLVTLSGEPDVAAAIEEVEERRRRDRMQAAGTSPIERDENGNIVFSPPKSALELAGMERQGQPTQVPSARDVKIAPPALHPRVATILAESGVGVPNRLSAEDTLRKLQLLGQLSNRSLEEIRNNATYPTIKAWADQKLREQAKE